MSRAREVSKIAISLEGVNFTQLVADIQFIDAENIINTASAAAVDYLTNGALEGIYQKIISYFSTAPEDPNQGDLWIDSTDNSSPILKVYNGTEWTELSGGGSEIRSGRFLLMGG